MWTCGGSIAVFTPARPHICTHARTHGKDEFINRVDGEFVKSADQMIAIINNRCPHVLCACGMQVCKSVHKWTCCARVCVHTHAHTCLGRRATLSNSRLTARPQVGASSRCHINAHTHARTHARTHVHIHREGGARRERRRDGRGAAFFQRHAQLRACACLRSGA